jgi:type VI protein secretion system component VasA
MILLLTRPEQSNTANQKNKQPEPAKTQNQELVSSPLSKATESKGKAKPKPSSPARMQEVEIETRLPDIQTDEYVSIEDDAYFEQIPESFYEQDEFQVNQQAGTTEKQLPSVIASDVTVTSGKLNYQLAIKNLIEQVQQSQRQSKPVDSLKSKHDEWCLVSDADIEEYLEAHPNLQRTRFMLDISRYPGCQNLGLRKGFKVRVKS